MFTKASLDPKLIEDILDDVLIIASDIDDTLIDAHKGLKSGVKALEKKLGKDLANMIYEMRQLTLYGARKLPDEPWDKRDDYNELAKNTKHLQRSFIDKYGLKKWSREVWITLAAKKLGKKLSPKEIEAARDTYWDAHTAAALIFDDTMPFLNLVKKKKIPLVLMTASNSIMNVDDDEMTYDSNYSSAYKKKNFDTLGISYDNFLTGDPIDKPHASFYDRVEEVIIKTLGFMPEPHQILAVGDSPLNDLHEPNLRGWKTLLIKR